MDPSQAAELLHKKPHYKDSEDSSSKGLPLRKTEKTDNAPRGNYKRKMNFGKNPVMDFLMTNTKAFKELREMSAFVTSILKASNYPFFVVDTEFNIQYMNPACLEFTGLNLKEVAGKLSCKDIFKSDLCNTSCAIQQAIKTKEPIIGKRVKVMDMNKKEHTIVVNAGALIDDDGEVLGGFEMWRDALPDTELVSRVNTFSSFMNDHYDQTVSLINKLEDHMRKTQNMDTQTQSMLETFRRDTNKLLTNCNSLINTYCWDVMNCPPERQVQCPAFPNNGRSCWDIDYTWCDGQMQGKAKDKKEKCESCDVKKNLSNGHCKR